MPQEILISEIWTDQSSASLAVTGSEKIVCENPTTADSPGIITPDALFTWLNTTKTLLTDAQVDALIAAAISALSVNSNLYIYYKGMLFEEAAGIRKGTLQEAMYCRDKANGYNISLAANYCKYLNSSFTAGTNNGGLDTGTFATNQLYYIWAIYNSSTAASDLLYSLSNSSPTLPSGFDKYRLIGAVYHVNYDAVEQFIQWTWTDINESGKLKPRIPDNYINPDLSITYKTDDAEITFDNVHVMDSTNTYEIHMPQSMDKLISAAWEAGDAKGINDLTLVEDTWYYLYVIMNPSTGAIDYYLDASATSPSLPSGYTIYRLIGLFYYFDDSHALYIAHSINDKWKSATVDVGALVKIGVDNDPGYEALFSGDGNTIRIATFNTGEKMFVDGCIYVPADYNRIPEFALRFFANAFWEDDSEGDAYFYLSYIITNVDGTEAIAAPDTIYKAITSPEVSGQESEILFAIRDMSAIDAGAKIWFTFGRLGNDLVNDTYAAKVGVTTFGFRYLSKKRGNDIETSDL